MLVALHDSFLSSCIPGPDTLAPHPCLKHTGTCVSTHPEVATLANCYYALSLGLGALVAQPQFVPEQMMI